MESVDDVAATSDSELTSDLASELDADSRLITLRVLTDFESDNQSSIVEDGADVCDDAEENEEDTDDVIHIRPCRETKEEPSCVQQFAHNVCSVTAAVITALFFVAALLALSALVLLVKTYR